MEEVEALAPNLEAQRDLVKKHVQSHTLAHLASWYRERPPPLPPEVPEAPLSEAVQHGLQSTTDRHTLQLVPPELEREAPPQAFVSDRCR